MTIDRRSFLKKAGASCAMVALASPLHSLFANTGFSLGNSFIQLVGNNRALILDALSIDIYGKSHFRAATLLPSKLDHSGEFIPEQNGNALTYNIVDKGKKTAAWKLELNDHKLTLFSSACDGNQPFEIMVDQVRNHITVLGVMKEKNRVEFPCVIHMPEIGSFRVTCDTPGVTLFYDASRKIRTQKWVQVQFPPATSAHQKVKYEFTCTTISPSFNQNDTVERELRKNFINIFQVNPRLRVLANNSSSDPCAFTLFKYATLARATPELATGLAAMDLIRMTLDRYLNGMKAYGLVGFTDNYEGADTISWKSPYNSLDALPSLLIAACYYIHSQQDMKWAANNYNTLMNWASEICKLDADNTGLIKHGESGNSGSWQGTSYHRPSNWWDTIGFGHEDAYANALAYHALTLFSDVASRLSNKADSEKLGAKAEQIKSVYYSTFFNPATGVLAGWKSRDGKLHDYYFTFVSGVAITYGLVEGEKANKIMDNMLAKMKEVGYTDFSLGLPGNLVSIRREDYTHREHRWGGGQLEDGSDAFQIYENGGATACFTYFTIKALQILGRKTDADTILNPILKSIAESGFSGKCENGMSKDWKKWNGECWGYEGFLVDNYLVLLAGV